MIENLINFSKEKYFLEGNSTLWLEKIVFNFIVWFGKKKIIISRNQQQKILRQIYQVSFLRRFWYMFWKFNFNCTTQSLNKFFVRV